MNSINPIGIPVVTESGQQLGRIVGVEIDPTTHGVLQYRAHTSRLPGVARELLIQQSQVISLSDEQMVVDDATTREAQPLSAAAA